MKQRPKTARKKFSTMRASASRAIRIEKSTSRFSKKSSHGGLGPKAHLTRGKTYLDLISNRQTWIHRRVETISFLSDDSTKRRFSYDFTLPPEVRKFTVGERIGVPIDNMRKETLKNLSVTDASGKALSIWGTDQNGVLGIEVLESLVSGYLEKDLEDAEKAIIRKIVFGETEEKSLVEVSKLSFLLKSASSKSNNEFIAAMAFVENFAKNFIFVVEVPEEYAGVRNIIKLSYDMEMADEPAVTPRPTSDEKKIRKWLKVIRRKLSISDYFPIKSEYWAESSYLSSSQSDHLEVHAPDDLQVVSLKRYPIDENGDRGIATESSEALGHIAHIHFRNDPLSTSGSVSYVEFAPVFPGLVIQTFVGVLLGASLLGLECLGVNKLYSIIPNIGDAGPLAAIALALPAFLLSLLVRSREHNYVKATLRAPRAVAFLSTCVLFVSSTSLVLKLSNGAFWWTLRILAGAQGVLLLVVSALAVTVLQANRPK